MIWRLMWSDCAQKEGAIQHKGWYASEELSADPSMSFGYIFSSVQYGDGMRRRHAEFLWCKNKNKIKNSFFSNHISVSVCIRTQPSGKWKWMEAIVFVSSRYYLTLNTRLWSPDFKNYSEAFSNAMTLWCKKYSAKHQQFLPKKSIIVPKLLTIMPKS